METKNEQNEHTTYFCKKCDYKCIKKTNFIRHLSSNKHILKQNVYKNEQENTNKFVCGCGKHYNSRNGLWKHKKICINIALNEPSDKELLLMLIKEQLELKKMVIEIYEKIKN